MWLNALLRLGLAAVFGVAAISKLFDRAGTRRSLIEFFVPASMAAPLAAVLPVAEAAAAVLLLSARTAWWGAALTIVLLAVFEVAIVVNLVKGRHPDCRCFGQLRPKPIGASTFVRNALLIAAAAVVLAAGSEQPPLTGAVRGVADNPTMRSTVLLALIVVAALEGLVIFELFRQYGRLLLRIEKLEVKLEQGRAVERPPLPPRGLPIGAPAPQFELPALSGSRRSLEALLQAKRPLVLIFSSPHCAACRELMPALIRWREEYAGRVELIFIAHGAADRNRALTTKYGFDVVLLDEQREIAEEFDVEGIPAAVAISPEGTMASRVTMGQPDIEALLRQTATSTTLKA